MACRMLFVTATDTGVGKTAVASALAILLRRRGTDVGVMKPVASGCEEVDGRLVSADAVCLAAAAGVDDPMDLVCPIRLRHPLAPMIAAELEGRDLDLSTVYDAADRLSSIHDCLIVEGIGGIMVPVTCDITVACMAAEMKAPLLVVGRSGLGTINHTLLTVEHARSRGLEVAAVLLNTPSRSDGGLAEQTNPSAVARLTGLPVLGPLGHCGRASVEKAEMGELASMLERLDGIDRLIADCFGA